MERGNGTKSPISKKIKILFQSYEFAIKESIPTGSLVGSVAVSDGDGLDTVNLIIRDVTATQYFRIKPNGQIFTNRKIDYEQVQRYVAE